jgi:hypothetical protein
VEKGQSANVKECAADFLVKPGKLKINFIGNMYRGNQVS